jgi:hypothetical protein
MDFEGRLQRAIQRGQQSKATAVEQRLRAELSEDEAKSLHSRYRLELSEHIEQCLRRVSDAFPGFDFSSVVSTDGWGAKISRDDIDGTAGRQLIKRYSRLEMLIKPYTSSRILELQARGMIRNKEVLSRNHFQFLAEADLDGFRELINQWILEYVEKFSAAD